MKTDALTTDVLVCGGGVAGCMAAVAAARQGAKVILVERYGFLGGNATAGAVAQFNSWQTGSGRKVVAGLATEVVERLRSLGAAGEHQTFVMSTGHKMDRVEYSPEVLKLVLDDMLQSSGVQTLFHSNIASVEVSNRRISAVQVLTKGGTLAIHPKVLIDASGDMDALAKAGAAFLPLQDGESLQPATMMFRFGPLDFTKFDGLAKDEKSRLAQMGFASGALARPALHASRNPFSSDGWFNISRVSVDATDALALSAAEMTGRQQAWRAAEFLKAHVSGCEAGQLIAFATQLGIRETRRIAGDYILTADDLLKPTHFEDAICMGAYPIDIHPNSGGGLQYQSLGDDHAYQIPYRSLIPAAFDNALVVGRGISATHEALAAVRIMSISMAVGQAAGTAATMAENVRQIEMPKLRKQLLADNAVLA